LQASALLLGADMFIKNGRNDRRRFKDDHKRRSRTSSVPVVLNMEKSPMPKLPNRPDAVRIIPLGGLGEIGKNIAAFEIGGDILIVDCGIMFPHEEMLGIDFVIPDIRYLVANKERIKGMILTHGHEDHIGAVPYVWPQLNCPVYGSALTIGLTKVKFEEFGISTSALHTIKPGDSLQLGRFKVDTFSMVHSMPGDLGLVIHTPCGKILHMADFRFDETAEGNQISKDRLAQLGRQGIFLLTMDSTNVEEKGKSLTENIVEEEIGDIFRRVRGRIIVTSFASSIPRIQSVIRASEKNHRKLFVSGRSMERNIEMAERLGYLSIPKNFIHNIKELKHIPDQNVAIMCTGSQGEEFSALTRIAAREHRQIQIKPGDTVVLSGSVIPGHERPIADTINNLFRLGADVLYGGEAAELHASGHAHRSDLVEAMRLTRPKYFLPMHGEYRHLVLHARLAAENGLSTRNIFVMENGQVLDLDKNGGRIEKVRVPSGYVLIDGLGVGDVGNIVLRDRQAMAKDGILVAIATIDRKNKRLLTSPDIISRGFVYMRENEELVFNIRQNVKKLVTQYLQENPNDLNLVKSKIRDKITDYIFDNTQRRPMVIPVIIEV
jgi:ribonuclease J